MTHDSGNDKYTYAANNVIQSVNLFDALVGGTFNQMMVSVEYTTSDTILIEATVNGGSNWETISNNEIHNFAQTGNDLRIRMTASGSASGEVSSWAIFYNLA